MYNFNFMEDEKLIEVFDEVLVKQEQQEKITTIALTDKRLLFLDYITNDGYEALKMIRGINFTKYKEVYHQIDLSNIKSIASKEVYYSITLKDNTAFEFNNRVLYELLKEEIDNKK